MATGRGYLDRVYTGWVRARESGLLARTGAFAVLAAAGLSTGGCSISVPMGGLAAKEPQSTGAIEPKPASVLSGELGEEDWRRAKGALAIALDPQGNGSPVNWDNPESLIKGNFVPVGRPFVKADEICRAFLATINGQASTSSVQGTACRPSGGEWAIKETKPWHKPA